MERPAYRVPVQPRRVLRPVPCPSGPAVLTDLLPALAAAVDGTGPALVPVPDGPAGAAVLRMAAVGEPLEEPTGADGSPDPVALVVPTSGSTGTPRGALLTASALAASAAATAERLGGAGSWLLCLPTTHVAGLQVLLRALAAGTVPECQDLSAGFTADGFTRAAAHLAGARRYTSLVPTQLVRLLDEPASLDALRDFDAVLLGGAAAPAPLLARARAAGVAVVATYGMSETCGGCVYDGVPLSGVRAGLAADGRITLAGAVVFSGYRRDPAATAAVLGGGVLTTGDLGAIRDDGRLEVLGRADAVLVTGGELVSPEAVERVLTSAAGIADAVVVGLADPEWGQRVVALVVPAGRPGAGGLDVGTVRALVTDRLGRASAPRDVVTVDAVPVLGIGKPDRAAAARLAARLLG